MDLTARTSINLPGAPPYEFEEWEEHTESADERIVSALADDLQTSGLHTGMFSDALYGGAEFPLFGPQYGIAAQGNSENLSSRTHSTGFGAACLDPYEDMFRQADADLQRAYLDSLQPARGYEVENEFGTNFENILTPIPLVASIGKIQPSRDSATALQSFDVHGSHPKSCIICTEDFGETVKPPGWISLACLHPPSVCRDCLAKCIKSDLDNKIWNQIKCPECNTSLIYEDIKQLADPATISRYEVLSFRSAVSADANFVWCQNCEFGQLHDSGISQPIVRCLECGFRSCFRHSVPWHDRLTCEEYDAMLQDPDGFQSAIDKADDAAEMARRLQEQEDEMLARDFNQRDKRAEQDRQKQRHEEDQRRARAAQKAEAERKKMEKDKARQQEELRRRAKENKLSVDKIRATTKQCPGCQWPIEKNEGCAHMTCTKCRHQFCWNCMVNWSSHGSRCYRR